LDDEGEIWAWGSNSEGQLGTGTTGGYSTRPVRVQAASGTLPAFTAIAAGSSSAYGLDKNGGIWAWGLNNYGQLGNGTVDDSSTPLRVRVVSGTLPVFTAIAAGNYSAYGLDKDGDIWAWGQNHYGQLGNGTTQHATTPVRVQTGSEPLPVFTAIATGGYSAYGLDGDGGVWAWGSGSDGRLGNGTNTSSSNPIRVEASSGTLPPIKAIAAGLSTGYALDGDGQVWAWGLGSSGQLGNGITVNRQRAERVRALNGALPVFTAIASAGYTGYALDIGGSIWAWGANLSGQVGDGTDGNLALNPVRVQAASGPLPPLAAIAAGGVMGYSLDKDGVLWAWGRNNAGQLGNGTTTDSSRAVQLPVTVGSVTFGGAPGTNLTFGNGQWSVKTPPGCGRLPVIVSYGFGSGTDLQASAGTFEFGLPPAIAVQPVSGTVISGQTFTTKVDVSGDPVPTVQWQSLVAGSWVVVPGATGVTLSVRPAVSTEYRAVATSCWSPDGKGESRVVSDGVTVTVQPSSSDTASIPGGPQSPKAGAATAVGLAIKEVTMKTKTSLKAVTFVYPLGAKAKLTWSSSKPKTARVDASGRITAIKPGHAVITATAQGGTTARLKVTVVAKTVKVKSVKAANTSTIKVNKGRTKRLSAAPIPAGATLTKMPTYKSSKPKVAFVDKTGLITAKKKGKAKITVTLAEKKTTLLILVT